MCSALARLDPPTGKLRISIGELVSKLTKMGISRSRNGRVGWGGGCSSRSQTKGNGRLSLPLSKITVFPGQTGIERKKKPAYAAFPPSHGLLLSKACAP